MCSIHFHSASQNQKIVRAFSAFLYRHGKVCRMQNRIIRLMLVLTAGLKLERYRHDRIAFPKSGKGAIRRNKPFQRWFKQES